MAWSLKGGITVGQPVELRVDAHMLLELLLRHAARAREVAISAALALSLPFPVVATQVCGVARQRCILLQSIMEHMIILAGTRQANTT